MGSNRRLQTIFFLVFFIGAAVLAFFVFLPFLKLLIFAVVLAVVLYPVYRRVLSSFKGREGLAAFAVILIAGAFVIIPFIFLSVQIVQESTDLYYSVMSGEKGYLKTLVAAIEKPVQHYLPNFSIDLKIYAEKFFNWTINNFGSFVSGTAQVILDIFLIIIALFFFLRDGGKFKEAFIGFCPLDDVYDREIIERVAVTINSVMKGTFFVAVIQGFFVGLGLTVFGISNPVLWGCLAAVCSLIPGLGTALVIAPAVVYLAIIGQTGHAIGLSVWGVLIVGLIDNFLTPYFYKKGTEVHSLFMLFSVFGGLVFFGPIGFLLGPVVLSFFLSLSRVYRSFALSEAK